MYPIFTIKPSNARINAMEFVTLAYCLSTFFVFSYFIFERGYNPGWFCFMIVIDVLFNSYITHKKARL